MLSADMVPRTRADEAATPIPRWRFTIDDYHRMGEAGVVTDDDRVELLDGEIVAMSSIGIPHSSSVDRLTAFFGRRLGRRAILRVQGPIILDDWSEPQPDLSVLAPRADFYGHAQPRPRDVLLAVEVMDSSRSYDRTLKLPLYARAGLREVWLVDLQAEVIERFRRPALRAYREHETFGRGRVLAPLAFPRARFRVNEILG